MMVFIVFVFCMVAAAFAVGSVSRKMAWLADWSHLRGIPRVSAWVGSRRWARLLAWWVFPFVSWGLLVLSLSLLAMGLLRFGLLPHYPTDPFLEIILFYADFIIFPALFFSITWGLPTIMYSFLLEPHKELPPAGSWVDYLDPDYVLKVPYAHTAQEKS